MKKTFKIPVWWSMIGEVYIEAENLNDALNIAKWDTGIGIPEDSEYMDSSWEVNRECAEEMNDENGEIKDD